TGGTNTPPPHPLNQELIYVFAGGSANAADPAGGFGDVLVTPPATAKNVISVGATDKTDPGNIAPFSSFGPTEDGRLKPDIAAPGMDIHAAVSQASYTHFPCGGCDPNDPLPPPCAKNFKLYDTTTRLYGPENAIYLFNGTSFSAPAVAGGVQLLWWWFQNRLMMLQPSPAMAKAYILNSARYIPMANPLTGLPDRLPSIAQGMGRMDLARMFDGVPRVLRDQSTPRAIDPPLLTTNPVVQQTYFTRAGQSYELSGQIADGTKPFRVTLAWSDAPGNPAALKQLVNNLDLQVTVNGQVYLGNIFDREFSTVDLMRDADDLNNVESVFLPAGTTGTFHIVVRAVSLPGDGVPNVGPDTDQDFALVVYNANNAFGLSDLGNLRTNDVCQTAKTITSYPFVWTNNLTTEVYRNVHPSPSAGRGGVEEFFRIPRPTGGTVFVADTRGSKTTAGTELNTVLSVWRGDCGALVELTSNDNDGTNKTSRVTWTADGTNTYYLVVEGRSGMTGTVVLNVTASAPQIGFTPVVLDFGSQYVGGITAAKLAAFQNGTAQQLRVLDVWIEGEHAGDFELVRNDCLDSVLPPGGSCPLEVVFKPTATGARNAELVIADSATGGPRRLPLTGYGLPPIVRLCRNTTALNFGLVPVGSTSAVQTVTITSCGTTNLTITHVGVLGPSAAEFAVTSDCSGPLPPGAGSGLRVPGPGKNN
ncbi:MAG: choice-of-anchor D domain-containing protein, partial [Verrucomicrobiae bacterium]|nr:choice-of-anchor D domain-containing protein [Verrucomicrobiae bacterium]